LPSDETDDDDDDDDDDESLADNENDNAAAAAADDDVPSIDMQDSPVVGAGRVQVTKTFPQPSPSQVVCCLVKI